MLREGLAPRDVPQPQRAGGEAEGLQADGAGEAQPRHDRGRARRSRAARPYYWIEEGENDWEPHDRSDFQAVRDGYVSVTPLQPDMTDYNALAKLETLALETTPCDSPA